MLSERGQPKDHIMYELPIHATTWTNEPKSHHAEYMIYFILNIQKKQIYRDKKKEISSCLGFRMATGINYRWTLGILRG